MNPANLQLEGLYLVLAALDELLVSKGVVSREELDQALHKAEAAATSDERAQEISLASRDAMAFAARFLRRANDMSAAGEQCSFTELARLVGQRKQPYDDQM